MYIIYIYIYRRSNHMIGQLHSLSAPTRSDSRTIPTRFHSFPFVSIRFHNFHGQVELTDPTFGVFDPLAGPSEPPWHDFGVQ